MLGSLEKPRMTPERWQQVTAIFHAARTRDTADRAVYLADACRGDASLRQEVEAMLAADARASSFGARSLFASGVSFESGTVFGAYRIERLLGRGGMGEVYRARDTTLGRDVAIKVLPATWLADPGRLERFQREARVLAALNHPNIAAIYGIEQVDAVYGLVLELVEGPTLAERIARGPLPLDEALGIARQIAEAIEAAHDRGVVHRDVKPSNIILTRTGVAKVLDFGLATTTVGDALSGTQSPTMAPMTGEGVIVGTVAYMSPEQARGQTVDRQTDIWAFGCVLFEMLTGARAFTGDTLAEISAAVLKSEPEWSALPTATPIRIRDVLRRCLQKDRALRLRDAGDVRIEIVEAVSAPTSPERGTEPLVAIWRRAAIVALAAVVPVVAGVLAWGLKPAATTPIVARFPIVIPDRQAFSSTARRFLAVSPDGSEMVYAADERLYRRLMSDVEAHPIAGTDGSSPGDPAYSPDGAWLAFYSRVEQAVKKIAVGGGVAVTLCDAPSAVGSLGLSWDASGILFGQPERGIMRVSPSGGKPEVLVDEKDDVLAGPHMLPGGQQVLFSLSSATGSVRWDKAQVAVQDLRTGNRTVLVGNGDDGRYLPTGHLVYVVGGTVFAVPFDVARLEVTGGPVPIIEGVRRASLSGLAELDISPAGSVVYVPGPPSTAAANVSLGIVNRTGGLIEILKLAGAEYDHPRISPHAGKRLAFAVDNGVDANVFVYDLGGATTPRRLTFDGKNRFPVWSADGQRVTYQSDRDGELGIYWQQANGDPAPERLTRPESGTSHVPLAWSPDGRTLLFDVVRGASFSLSTLSASNKKIISLGDARNIYPTNAVFSPDGRWVAYTQYTPPLPGSGGVFVQPFPPTGVKYQISTTGIYPTWSLDGKELFYEPSGRLIAVTVTTHPTMAFGNPQQIAVPRWINSPNSSRTYDVTANGTFIGVLPLATAATSASEIRVVLNWTGELKRLVPTK
jgi:Tol biopolymer transport system component